MNPFLLFSIFFLLLLSACQNSDEILSQSSPEDRLQIEAFLILLSDSTQQKKQADTLLITDSIFFAASIFPSKNINLKSFYWTHNEARLSAEYSFRTILPETGYHSVSFTVIDLMGDSLCDTVHVWVTQRPELDSLIAPRDFSQGISFQEGVSFVWNLTNFDPETKVSYQFKLSDGKNIYADTLLETPFYFYSKPLPSLQKMNWNVQAVNEFNVWSKNPLSAVFYTQGAVNEGGIFAEIQTKNPAALKGLSFELKDSTTQTVSFFHQNKLDSLLEKGILRIAPLLPGFYSLKISNPLYPDYHLEKFDIEVYDQEVKDLGLIVLIDSVQPQIYSLDTLSTVLPAKDTLSFLLKDHGLPLTSDHISILFNGVSFSDWIFANDTLRVFTHNYNHSFVKQVLLIQIQDGFDQNIRSEFHVLPFSQINNPEDL